MTGANALEARTADEQRALNVRNATAKIEAARTALQDADEVLRFALDHANTGHSDIAGCLNGLHSFVKGELQRRKEWLAALKKHNTGDVDRAEWELRLAKCALSEIETLRGVGFARGPS